MMIYGDKKKILSSILDPEGEEISPPESSDGSDEIRTVVRELIDAIHAKDTDGAVESLKAAMECLSMGPEEKESSDVEEE